MPERLSETAYRVGDARVDVLDDGAIRLDGGAMFRVVPRVMWEKRCPPDALNRIRLALRPLLVRVGGKTVLVDAGIGAERRDAAFAERVALEPGPGLVAGLRAADVAPEQVDLVVLSHLHWDHAGGLLEATRARFASAAVVVQRDELEDGVAGCPLCKASYAADDWRPLEAEGRLRPVDGDVELAPGVRVVKTGGHSRGHQVVRVESGGEVLVFWGDLVPTTAHLRPHWVMAFDLFPVQSWEVKRDLLAASARPEVAHAFYHDPDLPLARLVPDGRDLRAEPIG